MELKSKKYLDFDNGVLSVYPPTDYLTNGVWIYLVPQFKPKNVLILGYAGGTVAGLIRLLYGDVPITGVDINSCDNLYDINFIRTDANEYIKTCPNYDVVIIDLFECDSKDPSKFIFTNEFMENLQRIANYIIINVLGSTNMNRYKRKFHRFGSNKPNRLANRIYYFGTGKKSYNDLILK